MMRLAFVLLARLSLRQLHALGEAIAWLLWVCHGKRRAIALRNVERCFPELDAGRRERMARAAIAHEIKCFTELPLLWFGPAAAMHACLREVSGLDKVEAAMARGQGLLILSMHLGSFEGAMLPYSRDWTITGVYKPQKGAAEALALEGRSREKGKLVKAVGGVRHTIIPLLAANEQVYVLPDQDPPPGRGVYSPFFGHLAHTPTLVAKVLAESDCAVLFVVGERLPRGQGYHLHFIEPTEDLRGGDIQACVDAMNRDIEALIRRWPEQYWWGYRRFRRQPEGAPDFYA